jgi:hypothetical protein
MPTGSRKAIGIEVYYERVFNWPDDIGRAVAIVQNTDGVRDVTSTPEVKAKAQSLEAARARDCAIR